MMARSARTHSTTLITGLIGIGIILGLFINPSLNSTQGQSQEPAFKTLSRLGGPAEAVAVSENIGLFSEGEQLHILDLTAPRSPRIVETIQSLGDTISQIEIENNRAYVAARSAGIFIIDLSEPTRPTVLNEFHLGEGQIGIVGLDDNHLYTNYNQHIYQVDISKPRELEVLGNIENPSAYHFGVDNKIVWAASGKELRALDFSDPQSIRIVHTLTTTQYIRGIAAADQKLFLADSAKTLQVYDVTDPSNPDLIRSAQHDLRDLRRMRLTAGRLLLFDRDELRNFKIDPLFSEIRRVDPLHPALNAACFDRLCLVTMTNAAEGLMVKSDNRPAIYLDTFGPTYDIGIGHDLALLGNGPAGTKLLDISDPWKPAVLDADPNLAMAGESAIIGPIGLVADKETLQIHDLTAGRLDKIHQVSFPDPIRKIAGYRHFALIAYSTKVDVFDLSDPEGPVRVDSIEAYVEDIYLDSDRVYFTPSGMGSLGIYQIRPEGKVELLGTWDDAGWGRSVTAKGDLAYVSLRVPGMDFVTPPTPRPSVTPGGPTLTPTPTIFEELVEETLRREPIIQRTQPPDGGRILAVDISTPAAPKTLTRYGPKAGLASSLALDPALGRLFASGRGQNNVPGISLSVFDTSDPRQLPGVNSAKDRYTFSFFNTSDELLFVNGKLFVAGAGEGFWIFRHRLPGDPTPLSTLTPSATPSPKLPRNFLPLLGQPAG